MKNIYQKLKYSELNLRKYISYSEEEENKVRALQCLPTLRQNAVAFKELIIWLLEALQ